MADSMTMLMQSRDKHGMRQLVNAREVADIASGTPYLHYSPQLAAEGIGVELAAEIGQAGYVYHHLLLVGRIGKCIGKEWAS